MKNRKRTLFFLASACLFGLAWWSAAVIDQKIFFEHAEEYGWIRRDLIEDLPPTVCAEREIIAFRVAQGTITYRCSSLSDDFAVWPFYEQHESTRIPEVVHPTMTPRVEATMLPEKSR